MKNQPGKLLVFVVGPTAIGKTTTAIQLASVFNSEIISADSRQIYRELNIGTAKPDPHELAAIPHHLINSHSIEEDYNAFDFELHVLELAEELFKHNDVVFVAGGSGLYLHAIWHGFDAELPEGDPLLRKELEKLHRENGLEALQSILRELDPATYDRIDLKNPIRLIRAIEVCKTSEQPVSGLRQNKPRKRDFRICKIGLDLPRNELYQRINNRVNKMMSDGLLVEAENLVAWRTKNALKTVGYQELFQYFDGTLTLEEAVEKIKVNSRRYAKRQMSWFRRYNDIHWFPPTETEEMISLIQKEMNQS